MCDRDCRSLPSPPGPSPLGLTACQDETLKQSFLTAILMLVGAVSRNEGAHSYEFSQVPQLLECLMVSTGSGAQAGVGAPPLGPAALRRGPHWEGWAVGFLEPPRCSHLEAHPRPPLPWSCPGTWLRPRKATTARSAYTDPAQTTSY